MNRPIREGGFTLFEAVIVVALLGLLAVTSLPSILNLTEVRVLDLTAREIMTTLQLARWQAVSTKLNHRLRFAFASGRWAYCLEVENPSGTWTAKRSTPAKTIPSKLAAVMTLPASSAVAFTGTGFVTGYESNRSEIALVSSKLGALGQENRRLIRFFASGSLRLTKARGG